MTAKRFTRNWAFQKTEAIIKTDPLIFEVFPADVETLEKKPAVVKEDASPADVVNPASPAEAPEPKKTVSETFVAEISNSGSCTEENVRRNEQYCLASTYKVTDFTGTYLTVNNGSATVRRTPDNDSCIVVSLQYSDKGRGLLGDCRGNGWVKYSVRVNGVEK